MSVKGQGSNAGITKAVGRPKTPSIGYNGHSNPKGAYIINYHRDSVNIHKGQSLLRKLTGK